jgi:hypothetical protein
MNFFECYKNASSNNDFFDNPENLDQFMSCLTDTIDEIKNTTEENFLSSLDEQILDFANERYDAEQPLDSLILPLLAIKLKERGHTQSFAWFSKQRKLTTETEPDFLYQELVVKLVSYAELNLSLREKLFDFTLNRLRQENADLFFEEQLKKFDVLRPSQQLLILAYLNDLKNSSERMKRVRKTHRSEITDLLAFNDELMRSLLSRWKIKKPFFSLAALQTVLMRYLSSGRSMKTFSLLLSKQMVLLVVILLWAAAIGGTVYQIYLFKHHWQIISEKNDNSAERVIEQLKNFE